MTTPQHQACDVHPCPFSEEVWAARLRELETAMERTNNLLKWGMGLMVSVGMVVSGVIYQGMDNRVRTLEADGSAPLRERVARVERSVEAIDETLRELKVGQKEILARLAK